MFIFYEYTLQVKRFRTPKIFQLFIAIPVVKTYEWIASNGTKVSGELAEVKKRVSLPKSEK